MISLAAFCLWILNLIPAVFSLTSSGNCPTPLLQESSVTCSLASPSARFPQVSSHTPLTEPSLPLAVHLSLKNQPLASQHHPTAKHSPPPGKLYSPFHTHNPHTILKLFQSGSFFLSEIHSIYSSHFFSISICVIWEPLFFCLNLAKNTLINLNRCLCHAFMLLLAH